jgi:hypothetical protein
LLVATPLHASETISARIPLEKITSVRTAELRGMHHAFTFKLPLPERWVVRKAVLHFSYVNSSALQPKNSRLVFSVNQHPLAQVALQPEAPEGEVAVNIPAELLQPGYNDCEFSVAQHYNLEDCEDPSNPELWTMLRLGKTHLDIDYALAPVPLRLSAISNFLFDEKCFTENRVHLVIEENTPTLARLAALAATGVALRYNYRPVFFTLSGEPVADTDNIVIGGKEFVAKLLGDEPIPLDGPVIHMAHLTLPESGKPVAAARRIKDAGHALIVISGASGDQLETAARAFAVTAYPFPDAKTAEILSIQLPDLPPYTGKNMLVTGETVPFRDLGLHTATFRGTQPAPAVLYVRLPSDLFLKPNLYVQLSLHLVYGSRMRSDSTLNVTLNGQLLAGIPLEKPQGGSFEGYKVEVPAYLFRRGMNEILFDPVLTPSVSNWCTQIQKNNLVLTLFDDSSVKIPDMPHWIDLPRLEAMLQDGFPFMKWPDGRDALFYIPHGDTSAVAAAINLSALFAQKIGFPGFGITYTYDAPRDWNREIVVFGDYPSIPEAMAQAAPFKMGSSLSFPFPQTKESAARRKKAPGLAWGGFLMPQDANVLYASPSRYTYAHVEQRAVLDEGSAVLMAFESPFHSKRSVAVLTASNTRDVLMGARALWQPEVQGKIAGDLAMIDLGKPDYGVASLAAGQHYYVGDMGTVPVVDYYVNKYPRAALVALLASLLVLAFGSYRLLTRFRRNRMGS